MTYNITISKDLMRLKKHKMYVDSSLFDTLFEETLVNWAPGNNYTPDDVRYYIEHGLKFEPLCRIIPDSYSHRKNHSWEYTEIDQTLMYNGLGFWCYLITVDNQIQKVGECANPLGIRTNNPRMKYTEPQPKHGTVSRIGRYRTHGSNLKDTDYTIRLSLKEHVENPETRVEFWVMKCKEWRETIKLNGHTHTGVAANNKAMEHFLLDHYNHHYGNYPPLNKARC